MARPEVTTAILFNTKCLQIKGWLYAIISQNDLPWFDTASPNNLVVCPKYHYLIVLHFPEFLFCPPTLADILHLGNGVEGSVVFTPHQ